MVEHREGSAGSKKCLDFNRQEGERRTQSSVHLEFLQIRESSAFWVSLQLVYRGTTTNWIFWFLER